MAAASALSRTQWSRAGCGGGVARWRTHAVSSSDPVGCCGVVISTDGVGTGITHADSRASCSVRATILPGPWRQAQLCNHLAPAVSMRCNCRHEGCMQPCLRCPSPSLAVVLAAARTWPATDAGATCGCTGPARIFSSARAKAKERRGTSDEGSGTQVAVAGPGAVGFVPTRKLRLRTDLPPHRAAQAWGPTLLLGVLAARLASAMERWRPGRTHGPRQRAGPGQASSRRVPLAAVVHCTRSALPVARFATGTLWQLRKLVAASVPLSASLAQRLKRSCQWAGPVDQLRPICGAKLRRGAVTVACSAL